MIELDDDLLAIWRHAAKRPLLEARDGLVFDRAWIEARLPHRQPLLFMDAVSAVDREGAMLAARYTLDPGDPVFSGHFPGRPVWPGVLQVEAIGQAGILLQLLLAEPADEVAEVSLTHILGARFLRPLRPGNTIEIVAMAREDGLFFAVVGQCLLGGEVASVAAMRGMLPE